MRNLSEIGSPIEFWEYFLEISKIPHCPGNEKGIRELIQNEAKKFNYETKIDEVGNLLVRIPPIKEKNLTVTIQSHMDVCEKNEAVKHDFAKDPLKLRIVQVNGKKWVTAESTTLGADNGVGLAYALVLMKKIYNGEMKFDRLGLDLLFTVAEEDGLIGAFQIDKDLIHGNYLINLDTGRENVITIGSVGTLITTIEIKIDIIPMKPLKEGHEKIKINVIGLLGGHSGVEIHKGRANSIKLLARILYRLNNKYTFYVKSINGGKRFNAIPRESNATIYVKKNDVPEIESFIHNFILEIKDEYTDVEDNLDISLKILEYNDEDTVFSKDIQSKVLSILHLFPNGPISMHSKFKNLVFTSTNFGSILTKKNRIKIVTSQRSFKESSYNEVSDKIIELFKLADLKIKFKQFGYGVWTPNFNSKLLKLSQETFKELFNEDATIRAVHGGLETGVFRTYFPDLDMISIGPNQEFAHSPDERLDVQSVEKFWTFLIHLLTKI